MSAEIVEDKVALPAPAKPKSKKQLIIIGAAAAVTLIGGGGGAFVFLSGGSKAEAADSHSGKKAEAKPGDHGEGGTEGADGDFVDVPAMVVNLRSPDGGARFLKLHFLLVPGPNGNAAGLKDKLPLILDAYQPFLRELRPEDLAGSAAVFRIKEELLMRANSVAGTGAVKDILIEDLVQQ
ncbi:MAG: flagellar basal body-associated FliL family protein [Sphingomonas sp.]